MARACNQSDQGKKSRDNQVFNAEIRQVLGAGLNELGVFVKKSDKFCREEPNSQEERKGHQIRNANADPHGFLCPPDIACAHILGNHGGDGSAHRGAGHDGKAIVPGDDPEGCGGSDADAVGKAGHGQEGQVGQHVLDDNGHAGTGDELELVFFDAKGFGLEVKHEVGFGQIKYAHEHAEGLGNDGCDGSSPNLHAPVANKDNVQGNINDAGAGHEIQGRFGISHASHDAAERIVAKDKNTAQDGDAQVVLGIGIGFKGCLDEPQYCVIEQEHEACDCNRHKKQKGQQGADGLFGILSVPGANILGDDDGATGTQGDGDIGHDKSDLSANIDAGDAVGADIAANNEHVGDVVKGLDDIGQHKGQGKEDEFLCDAAGGKVFFKLGHEVSFRNQDSESFLLLIYSRMAWI